MHIYIWTRIYTYIYIYKYIYTYVYIDTCTYTYAHIHLYVDIDTGAFAEDQNNQPDENYIKIDIKKSTYKNVLTFLNYMEEENFLCLKKDEIGTISVTYVQRSVYGFSYV
jgi:hypothetical protein